MFAVSYKYTVFSEANRSWRKHCYYILITRFLHENQQLLIAFSCMQSRPTLKKKCHSTDIYSSITKTLNTFQKISGRVIFGSLVLQIPYRDKNYISMLSSLARKTFAFTHKPGDGNNEMGGKTISMLLRDICFSGECDIFAVKHKSMVEIIISFYRNIIVYKIYFQNTSKKCIFGVQFFQNHISIQFRLIHERHYGVFVEMHYGMHTNSASFGTISMLEQKQKQYPVENVI